MGFSRAIIFLFVLVVAQHGAKGEIPRKTMHMINVANMKGPYIGVVIPNLFELNPLLQSPSYKSSNFNIDFSGTNTCNNH